MNRFHAIRPSGPAPWLGVVLAVGLLDFATLIPGWWWATAVVAVAGGWALRGGPAFLALLLGSVLGWAAELVGQTGGELGRLADLVGVVATGESGEGWLPLVATAVTVLALSTTGAWLGGAVRRLATPPAEVAAP